MMPIMSVFFAVLLYSMPSGLNLYIMASSLFGTLEQWRIRKHIKEVKARGESLAPRSRRGDAGSNKPSWFMRRVHALQKRAEEAQRIQSNRKR
jgi:membrane protein insertase Oxa1/YidC/SpoIIIJ